MEQLRKVRVENEKRFTAVTIDKNDSFLWAEGYHAGKSTCERITVVDPDKGHTVEEEIAVKAVRIINGKLAKGYKVVSGQDILDQLEALVATAGNKKKEPKDNAEKIAKMKEKIEKAVEKLAKIDAKKEAVEKHKADMEAALEELETPAQ